MTANPFAYVEGKANWTRSFQRSDGVPCRDQSGGSTRPGSTIGRPPDRRVSAVGRDRLQLSGRLSARDRPGRQTSLSDVENLLKTPAGKAMRFQHAGSYADIDSTYDAITAYLDEKGIDAQDSFVEEYQNDVKTPTIPICRRHLRPDEKRLALLPRGEGSSAARSRCACSRRCYCAATAFRAAAPLSNCSRASRE